MACCEGGLSEVDVKALILECLADAGGGGGGGVDTNTTYSFSPTPNADGTVNLVDSDGNIIGPVCPVCSEGGVDTNTTYVLSGPVDNGDGTSTITLTGSDGTTNDVVIETPTFELPDGTPAPAGTAAGSICVGSKAGTADGSQTDQNGDPIPAGTPVIGPDENGNWIPIVGSDDDEIATPDGAGGFTDNEGDPLAAPATDVDGDPINPDALYAIDANGAWCPIKSVASVVSNADGTAKITIDGEECDVSTLSAALKDACVLTFTDTKGDVGPWDVQIDEDETFPIADSVANPTVINGATLAGLVADTLANGATDVATQTLTVTNLSLTRDAGLSVSRRTGNVQVNVPPGGDWGFSASYTGLGGMIPAIRFDNQDGTQRADHGFAPIIDFRETTLAAGASLTMTQTLRFRARAGGPTPDVGFFVINNLGLYVDMGLI